MARIDRLGNPENQCSPFEGQRPLATRVLDLAVPALERHFVETAGPDTFILEKLGWEHLQRFSEAGIAPGAAQFLTSFPDDYVGEPRFGGRLVLPPARQPGFFVDQVDARVTKAGKKLLSSAVSVIEEHDRVFATWRKQAKRSTRGLPKEQVAFVKAVEAHLKAQLGEAGHNVWRFTNAPWKTVEALASSLGDAFLNGGHHEKSPTVRELLEATSSAQRATLFGGTVVWPPRADFSITVMSVTAPATDIAKWRKAADESKRDGRKLHLRWY